MLADPALTLEVGGKCPVEQLNVVCIGAAIYLGSAFGREDATTIQLDSKYFFGMVSCLMVILRNFLPRIVINFR